MRAVGRHRWAGAGLLPRGRRRCHPGGASPQPHTHSTPHGPGKRHAGRAQAGGQRQQAHTGMLLLVLPACQGQAGRLLRGQSKCATCWLGMLVGLLSRLPLRLGLRLHLCLQLPQRVQQVGRLCWLVGQLRQLRT